MERESLFHKKNEGSRLRSRRKKRIVSLLAALALTMNCSYSAVITDLAAKEKTSCEMEEHVHTQACYTEEKTLICGQEESAGHTHGAECYTESSVLICGQEESAGHAHGSECYKENTTVICGQEESAGHTHGSECYKENTTVICGQEECAGHTHDAECYTEKQNLICELEENEDHTHGEDCYETVSELTCGQEEKAGHTHGPECMQTTKELICGQEESAGHVHGEECLQTTKELICSQAESAGHNHSDECYQTESKLTCTLEESTGHTHQESCWQEKKKETSDTESKKSTEAAEDERDGEAVYLGNYIESITVEARENGSNSNWTELEKEIKTATKAALEVNETQEIRFTIEYKISGKAMTGTDSVEYELPLKSKEAKHDKKKETAYTLDKVTKIGEIITDINGKTEICFDGEYLEQNDNGKEIQGYYQFIIDENQISFDENGRGTVSFKKNNNEKIQIEFLLQEESSTEVTTEAVAEETEVTTEAVTEEIEVTTEAVTEEIEVTTEAVTEETEAATETDAEVSMPPVVLTQQVGDILVSLSAEEGVLPEGTTMKAVPVETAEVEAAVEAELAAEGKELVSLFSVDITLYDRDGNEIQPQGTVNVTFNNVEQEEAAEQAMIMHVAEDGSEAEKITDILVDAETVDFEAEHFSVYSLVKSRTIATMATGSFEVYPAVKNAEGGLTAETETISVQVEALVGIDISLDSPGITIDGTVVSLAGRLFYSDSENVTTHTDTQKVAYLTISKEQDSETGEEIISVTAHLADDKEVIMGSSGSFLYVDDEEVLAVGSASITEIQVREKNGVIVQSTEISNAYVYYKAEVVGKQIALSEITGNATAKYYYGTSGDYGSDESSEEVTGLTRITNAVLKLDDNGFYRWFPVDKDGNAVNASIYMETDRLYSFDVTIINMVNEHSEDDGNIYLWRDKDKLGAYQLLDAVKTQNTDKTYSYTYTDIPENLLTVDSEIHKHIDVYEKYNAQVLNMNTSVKTVTGRMGDVFTVSDEQLGELIIYATDDNEFSDTWYYVGTDPSDKGSRLQYYGIRDWMCLNTYSDTVAYFRIVDSEDGAVLKTTLTKNETKDVSEYTFYTTRAAVVAPLTEGTENKAYLDHVQVRMPATITTIIDGELCTGSFELCGGTVEAYLLDESGNVVETLISKSNFETDNAQESKSKSLSSTKIKKRVADMVDGDVLFDNAERIIIKVTYQVKGELKNSANEVIQEYTAENPFKSAEITLTSEQLWQAYEACPNHGGYDVFLDLSAAITSDVSTEKEIKVSKVWSDADNQLGTRPEKVTFTLARSKDGNTWEEFDGNTVVLTAENAATGNANIWEKVLTDTNLDMSYQYKVLSESFDEKEDIPYRYSSSINGMSVTNTLQEYTSIEISKTWKDQAGEALAEKKVPDEINVVIYQNGGYYRTVSLTKENNWTLTVENLPIVTDGKENTYTIAELDDNGLVINEGTAKQIDGVYYLYSQDTSDAYHMINQEYKATGSVELVLDKKLIIEGDRERGGIEEDEFTFTITEVDADNNESISGGDTYTIGTAAAGSDTPNETTARKTIEYLEDYGQHDIGIHKYKITEVTGNAVGVVYSNAVYYATVAVTDAGGRKLKTEVSYTYIDENGDEVAYTNGNPYFENSYHATYMLPLTGGPGTTLYTVGGLFAMMAACLGLLYNKKRRKEGTLS